MRHSVPYKDPVAKLENDRRRTQRDTARRRVDPEFRAKESAARKKWYASKRYDPAYVDALNRKRTLDRYQLDEAAYKRLLVVQGFVCAICGKPHEENKNKRLHVDHCHTTGAVRGLLCPACNTAIGKMKDSPDRLRAAADYLENAK